MELVPEERPRTICLGPIRNIPVVADDVNREVRWTARFTLLQAGCGPDPGLFDCREGDDGWCAICDGEVGLDDDPVVPAGGE